MFDRFTERARKVMVLSRMEAQKAGQDCIGTEHLLLAILEAGSGVAAQVLKNLGAKGPAIRAGIEGLVKKGNHGSSSRQLPFTPGSKSVLEFALEEAQGLGHNYIGTEHLLLGLLRIGDGPTARVLEGAGLGAVKVRDEVLLVLGTAPPAPAPSPTPASSAPKLSFSGGHDLRPSDDAKAVLVSARDEAKRLQCDYIGTEHLLLGLIGAESGIAGQALREFGMTLPVIRAEVERLVEKGSTPGLMLPFTPRAKRVLDKAVDEASALGDATIDAKHILLALVGERDGPAAHVFQNLVVHPDAVRARVLGTPPAPGN